MDFEKGNFVSRNSFLRRGRELMSKEQRLCREWLAAREQQASVEEEARGLNRDVNLLQGKLKREDLKAALLAHLYE